jgi:LuxR family maltose regulon positive regulatory protein
MPAQRLHRHGSHGDRETAAASLLAAERILRQRPSGHDLPVRLAAAILRLALLSRARQWPSAAAAAKQAHALFTSIPASLRARHPDLRVQLLTAAGTAEMWSGQFNAAAVALATAVDAADDEGQRARGLGYLALAEALRGRLSHAAGLASEVSGAAPGEPAGNAAAPSPAGLVTLAYVHAERNELRDAHLRLRQASVALRAHPDPMTGAVAALVAARVFLAEGRPQLAAGIIGRARHGPASCPWLDRGLVLAQSEACAVAGEAEAAPMVPPAPISRARRQAGALPPSGDPLVLEKLSDREREVLQCASQLLDTTEIASELFISVNTVKSHFKSIFRKLDAPSRNVAVRRARRLNLI